MPRLGYETPCRAVPDRFLVVVRLMTFAVAVGLLGGFALLSPTVTEPGRPVAAITPVTPTSRPTIVAPPLTSRLTSKVVPIPEPPPPAPPPPPATTTPPPPATTTTTTTMVPPIVPAVEFAVVGEACATAGLYSVTEHFEPVVCRDGVWQPILPGS